jgi:hypothetical protein
MTFSGSFSMMLPFSRLVVILAIATPAIAVAQLPGGFGRGGRAPGITREKSLEIPKPVNMVNLLIEHRQDVALSDSQFKEIIVLKRVLDSTNAPQMRRLDSLDRLFRGGLPIFSSPSAARRDSIAQARIVMRRVIAIVEDNNASTRDRAYALLTEQQLTKVRTIQAQAEKALAESERPPSKP